MTQNKQHEEQPKVKTKIVIRNLPYNITEDEIKKTIEDYLPQISYIYFVPGRLSQSSLLEVHKEVPAKMFINFLSGESVIAFYNFFEGYIFIDAKGREHKASIEYAYYQKVPKKNQVTQLPKIEDKENTLEEDIDYKAFLEDLMKPHDYLPSAEVQFDERKKEEEEKKKNPTTPILEELRAKATMKIKIQTHGSSGSNGNAGNNGNVGNNGVASTRATKSPTKRSQNQRVYGLVSHVRLELQQQQRQR